MTAENRIPKLDPTRPEVMEKVLRLARYYLYGTRLFDSCVEYDIRQNVLMKLLTVSGEIKKPEGYLRQIVRNNVIDYLKKTDYFHEIKFVPEDISEIDNYLTNKTLEKSYPDTKILLSEIWEKKLDDEERQILQLLIYSHNQKEIADILEISHDSARKRVSRLRAKLKSLIFEESPS